MTSKKLLLVSLLVTVCTFTYSAANNLVSSLDDAQAEAMISELNGKAASQPLASNLRSTLSATAAAPVIPAMRIELGDTDFPIVGGDSDQPKTQATSNIRTSLNTSMPVPVIPAMRIELGDTDFPIVGGGEDGSSS